VPLFHRSQQQYSTTKSILRVRINDFILEKQLPDDSVRRPSTVVSDRFHLGIRISAFVFMENRLNGRRLPQGIEGLRRDRALSRKRPSIHINPKGELGWELYLSGNSLPPSVFSHGWSPCPSVVLRAPIIFNPNPLNSSPWTTKQ
jgi:hypothetical protein